jgi:hypothetical protein
MCGIGLAAHLELTLGIEARAPAAARLLRAVVPEAVRSYLPDLLLVLARPKTPIEAIREKKGRKVPRAGPPTGGAHSGGAVRARGGGGRQFRP